MSKNYQVLEQNQQHEKELTLEETEFTKKTRINCKIILSIPRETRGMKK